MVRKIISGGQAGTERAALDFALQQGIMCSGWCAKGKLAEDGKIDEKYPLNEIPVADIKEVVLRNLTDSSGSLVITTGTASGGAALTIELAYEMNKPFFVVNLGRGFHVDEFRQWFRRSGILKLNITGPTAGTADGIYEKTIQTLSQLFSDN